MDIGTRILKILQMLHVPSALLLLALVGAPVWRGGGLLALGVWKALPVCLASLGCFCINDAMDYRRDSINKPYRAVPSGAITPRGALVLGLAFTVVAVVAGLLAGDGLVERLAYVFIAVSSAAYSPLIRVIGPAKNLYVALAIAVAFLLAIELGNATVARIPFVVAVIIYCCGKELMMDIWDVEGDASDGAFTLPMVVGKKAAYALVGVCQVLPLTFFLLAGVESSFVLVATMLMIAMDVLAAVDVRQPGNRLARRASMYLSWLPLLACSAVLLL